MELNTFIPPEETESGIISEQEIINIIDSCEELRQKALFSILYLTGARIAELCISYKRHGNYNKETKKVESVDYLGSRPGILKKDIKMVGNDVHITLPIRKKRKKSDRRDLVDEHTLVISKDAPFMNLFIEYFNTIENDDDPIFDFTTRLAETWIKNIDEKTGKNGIYCHLFRKTRIVKISKIAEREEDIRQWSGHTDMRSLKPYTALMPVKKFKDMIK